MKRYVRLIIAAVLILVVAGSGYELFVGPDHASACGVGAEGGKAMCRNGVTQGIRSPGGLF